MDKFQILDPKSYSDLFVGERFEVSAMLQQKFESESDPVQVSGVLDGITVIRLIFLYSLE